jgi:hypothetical protein
MYRMTQKSLDTSGIILTSSVKWLLHSLVLAPVLTFRSPYIITKVIYYFRTYLELNNDYYFEEHDLIFRCGGEEVRFFAVGPEFSCNM